MKRFGCILLSCMLAAWLAGCGSKENKSNPSPTPAQTAADGATPFADAGDARQPAPPLPELRPVADMSSAEKERLAALETQLNQVAEGAVSAGDVHYIPGGNPNAAFVWEYLYHPLSAMLLERAPYANQLSLTREDLKEYYVQYFASGALPDDSTLGEDSLFSVEGGKYVIKLTDKGDTVSGFRPAQYHVAEDGTWTLAGAFYTGAADAEPAEWKQGVVQIKRQQVQWPERVSHAGPDATAQPGATASDAAQTLPPRDPMEADLLVGAWLTK